VIYTYDSVVCSAGLRMAVLTLKRGKLSDISFYYRALCLPLLEGRFGRLLLGIVDYTVSQIV